MNKDLLSKILKREYQIKEIDLKSINEIKNTDNIKVLYIKENNQEDIKLIIEKILLELGMPSNLKGYNYICEAIFLCLKNDEFQYNITKKLYPYIADNKEVKPHQVEKNIRKAIEVSWTNANPEILEELFGYSIGINRDRPTNSNYILTISNILK